MLAVSVGQTNASCAIYHADTAKGLSAAIVPGCVCTHYRKKIGMAAEI